MKFLVCVVEGVSFALKGTMTGLCYGGFVILLAALSMALTLVIFCSILYYPIPNFVISFLDTFATHLDI